MPQTRPRVRFQDTSIELAHGAGGKASRRLIEGLIAPYLFESGAELRDVAEVAIAGGRLAMTADAFVVKPRVFPGGSIGELAVNGTVNEIIEAAEEREPPLGKGSPKRETQADKRAKPDGKIKETPGLR